MDINKLIMNVLKKKRKVKASDIIKATGFSREYINRFFRELRDSGKLILVGKANKAHYVLATDKAVKNAREKIKSFHNILDNKELSEDTVFDNIRKNTGIFIDISKNVSRIINYAFTEMLNNAIEHSRSKKIEITMEIDTGYICFNVTDRGVGIFNNIMDKMHFSSEMDAIQDLMKGKLTTASQAHSGEGIFFTSKVADKLIIQSSGKKLIFDNLIKDIFVKDVKKNYVGTKIFFSINIDTDRKLSDIFKEYTGNSFEFTKTKVNVKLYKMGSEYISRSQARRILSGLDKFKTVILDFKGVETVGQGFVDEVFRVWKLNYPEIKIIPQNANENISFMINRALTVA